VKSSGLSLQVVRGQERVPAPVLGQERVPVRVQVQVQVQALVLAREPVLVPVRRRLRPGCLPVPPLILLQITVFYSIIYHPPCYNFSSQT